MSAFRALEVGREAVLPALAQLEPFGVPGGHAPCVFLLAVGLQESNLEWRDQVRGTAVGLWQFEAAGVRGVMCNPRSAGVAASVCDEAGVGRSVELILARIHVDDVFAAKFARLLLWTDPARVPSFGPGAPWRVYKRLWRPGVPRRERFDAAWQDAGAAWLCGLNRSYEQYLLGTLAGSGACA